MNKKDSLKKYTIIQYAYAIMLIIGSIFATTLGASNLNGIYIGLIAIVLFFNFPQIKLLFAAIIMAGSMILFSNKILNIGLDSLHYYMILSSFALIYTSNIERKSFKSFQKFIFCLNLLNIFLIPVPLLYNDGRYMGIFLSANVSSSILTISLVYYWELIKSSSNKSMHIRKLKNKLLSIILLVSLMFIFSKTRSLVLFVPYFIYESYKIFNKKFFYLCIILIIGIIGVYSVSLLQSMRMEEDGSSITRMYLYENLVQRILDNFMLIPYGSGSANAFTSELTKSDKFPTHMDFLKYLYDWGIWFWIVVGIITLFIYKSTNKKWRVTWILLGWSSCALHNILFIPTTWFGFILAIKFSLNTQSVKRLSKVMTSIMTLKTYDRRKNEVEIHSIS